MRRAVPLCIRVVAVVVACSACGGGSASGGTTAPPAPNTVRVADFAFQPDHLTVHVGDTVTWDFRQRDAPHNVVSLSGPASFNSGAPQGQGTYKYTFNQAGTYIYDCLVHPNMKGTVTVTP